MVVKTVEERESLVEELVRERKEKEEMARMRVETVEQLKISLNAQIDAVLGNLKVEMGDAEQAATPKEAVEITKIALENKRASAAVAPPKKSGSILGAIGGLFGMTSATEEGTEEATAPEPAATASDDEAVSEAAIKAAGETFDAEVKNLQATYEKLQKDKDSAIEKAKVKHLGVYKQVQAFRAKTAKAAEEPKDEAEAAQGLPQADRQWHRATL